MSQTLSKTVTKAVSCPVSDYKFFGIMKTDEYTIIEGNARWCKMKYAVYAHINKCKFNLIVN